MGKFLIILLAILGIFLATKITIKILKLIVIICIALLAVSFVAGLF